MKRILLPIAFSIFLSSCGALSSIQNTMQNTAWNKVNDKASQTTSNAMDTVLGNGPKKRASQWQQRWRSRCAIGGGGMPR